MEASDLQRLQRNRAALLDDLSADEVALFLVQEGVFTEDDAERVAAEKTRRDRVAKLLALLPFRGSKAYGIFREALQKDGAYTWLVEKLDATDVTSGGPAETIGPITELNTKVYLAMSQHYDVIKDWKSLARALGLTEADISDIEYKCHLGGPKEMAYQSLILWRRRLAEAPPKLLLSLLREHGYTHLADELEGR